MSDRRLKTASPTATPLPRVLKPRRAAPTDAVRPTRAEVSLEGLRHNLRSLRRVTRAPIYSVLKADAYGHGAKAVARTLERAGVNGVCVALLEEAIELREAGIQCPVLVMGGYYGQAWSEVLHHQLTPVIYDLSQLEALGKEASRAEHPAWGIHLKVDTGMARLGIAAKDFLRAVALLRAHPELKLQGFMTHFACADSSAESIDEQLNRFDEMTATLANNGLQPELRHAANSAALARSPRAHLDLVRPGIALFGVEPMPGSELSLKPVMRVLSQVIALRKLQPGESVGYGATWKAVRPSVIATVPIGYADGLSRSATNNGYLLVRGKRAPIVGAVSMDLTTIDATEIAGIKVGDEVVALGKQKGPLGEDTLTAQEIATRERTIPWEVLTNVSRRVPRFYRES
jgi:alanine racemase